jgi:hypothetical protein
MKRYRWYSNNLPLFMLVFLTLITMIVYVNTGCKCGSKRESPQHMVNTDKSDRGIERTDYFRKHAGMQNGKSKHCDLGRNAALQVSEVYSSSTTKGHFSNFISSIAASRRGNAVMVTKLGGGVLVLDDKLRLLRKTRITNGRPISVIAVKDMFIVFSERIDGSGSNMAGAIMTVEPVSGRVIRIRNHNILQGDIAVTDDKKRVVVLNTNGRRISVFDAGTLRSISSCDVGYSEYITKGSAKNEFILHSEFRETQLRIVNIQTCHSRSISARSMAVLGISVMRSGALLFGGGKHVYRFEKISGEGTYTRKSHYKLDDYMNAMSVGAGCVIAGLESGGIRFLDQQTLELKGSISIKSQRITSMTYQKDDKRLVVGTSSGKLYSIRVGPKGGGLPRG